MKLSRLLNPIKDQILSISTSHQRQDYRLVLRNSEDKLPRNFLDIDIRGLALNSKLVKKDYLFFGLSGSNCNGSDFINEAYKRGARVVILETKTKNKLPSDLIVAKVKNARLALGAISNKFYKFVSDKVNLTAVTGTNGKTTITFIIENILNAFRKQVGVIGTVNYRFADVVLDAINTTPDILTLQNIIDQMANNRVKYVVMEVSSHALAQRRIEGLKFDQAIFTNLTQDHFDYHKTKENYFAAKSKLFTDYLKEDGIAIINKDDIYGQRLIDLIRKNKGCKITTFGIDKKSDVCAKNISLMPFGSHFTVKGLRHSIDLETNLVGIFNIYNALAAISAALAMEIPEKYIKEGLRKIYIPGRLENIRCNNNISVFVDYAHTEDALKNILSCLGKLKGDGRLIVVFGCGGNRDKDKRHKMGRVATELADFVIITSDNPRFEDPKKIISDIKKGIKKINYTVLINREDAIKKAIDIAQREDIIVIAGKGHENYQIIKDKKIAFSDRKVTENILSDKGLMKCLN